MTLQQKMHLAIEHYSSGRVAESGALCREILDEEPQHAEALHLLGVVAHRAGHVEAAVEFVRQAVANQPRVEYYSNLGAMLSSLGRVDEAAMACRDAVALYPDLPEAHYNLGNALQASGDLIAAAASYRQAINLRRDYPQAHNNLGNVLLAMGDPAGAVAAYTDALRLRADFAYARSNLGNALKGLGCVEEALTEHRRAVDTAPAIPQI